MNQPRMLHIAGRTLLIAALPAIAAGLGGALGCTNAPGTLAMRLATDKPVYRPTEPIGVNVTLIATSETVRLGKGTIFSVELRHVDWAESRTNRPPGYCGNSFPTIWALSPILAPAAMLDVCDLSDRYDELSGGQERSHHLEIAAAAKGHLMIRPEVTVAPSWRPEDAVALPAGRYELRVTLTGTFDPRNLMNYYPPPLFWRPYDRPVSATTTFVVEDNAPVETHRH